MSTRFRRALLTASAAVLLATLASCASGASDDASDGASAGASSSSGDEASYGDLALQLSFVKNSQNSGEYIADTEGYYADAGFSSVDLIAGPTAVEASVVSGNADVGFSTVLGAAKVIDAEEMPVKIVGVIYQHNAFTILSMDGPTALRTPADLEGARIGVTAGTAQTIVEALAKANGVDPSTITFVPAEGNPALLTGGEVDGYFGLDTNERIVLEQQGEQIVSLPLAANGLPLGGTSFLVTQEAIDTDRERVKAFLMAEIRGWSDAVADPQEGVDLALSTYGADLGLNPEKEAAQGVLQLDYVYPESVQETGLFLLTPEAIETNIEALTFAGIEIAPEDLFDMSLLEEIYAENPDLLLVGE